MGFPGIGFTSASCSAYMHPERRENPQDSLPGSSQAGAKGHVKRKPHLACRLGLCRCETRISNLAVAARADPVCADLRLYMAERGRSAGRGTGADADQPVPVGGTA